MCSLYFLIYEHYLHCMISYYIIHYRDELTDECMQVQTDLVQSSPLKGYQPQNFPTLLQVTIYLLGYWINQMKLHLEILSTVPGEYQCLIIVFLEISCQGMMVSVLLNLLAFVVEAIPVSSISFPAAWWCTAITLQHFGGKGRQISVSSRSALTMWKVQATLDTQ